MGEVSPTKAQMKVALELKMFQVCGRSPRKMGGDARANVDGIYLAT